MPGLLRLPTQARPGTSSAIFLVSVRQATRTARTRVTFLTGAYPMKNVGTTTRNPLFRLWLFGLFMLR